MRVYRSASLLLLLSVLRPPVQAREPNVIRVAWSQVDEALQGRTVTIAVTSGKTIKGKFAAATAEGLTLDRGKRRGPVTVARQEIKEVKASRRNPSTKGRTIGSSIGGGVVAFFAIVGVVIVNNEGGSISPLGGAILAAFSIGAVAGGYYIGRAFDMTPVTVEITDLPKMSDPAAKKVP